MRVHQIDALRGMAALLVAAVFHVDNLIGVKGPFAHVPVLSWFHAHGWSLVDLFFVISGYIFAYIYLDEDGRLKGSVGSFALARFARLYPLQLLSLSVMVLVVAAGWRTPGVATDSWHYLLNLLMLQESGLNDRMSFNYPSWSISVEVFCYAIFVVAARWQALRVVAPLLIVVGFYLTNGPNETADHIGRGFVGYFVGYLLQRWKADPPALLLASVVILSFVVEPPIHRGIFYSVTAWPALLLLALKLPFKMQWLGDRSYSIYMLHAPVYAIGFLMLGKVAPPWQLPVMAIGIAAVLLASDLSYRFFECPARRWLNALRPAIPSPKSESMIGLN